MQEPERLLLVVACPHGDEPQLLDSDVIEVGKRLQASIRKVPVDVLPPELWSPHCPQIILLERGTLKQRWVGLTEIHSLL